MKKNILLLTLFTLTLNATAQVYVLDENFDGVAIPALPEGWTTTTNFDIGFRTEDSQSSDNATASGLNNAVMRNTDSTGVYTLYSPIFSTEGLVDIKLLWSSRVSNNYPTPGSTTPVLEYSANGGLSWAGLDYSDNTNNSTWAIVNDSVAIFLPLETYGNPQVQLRWTINIVNDPSGSYRIDDVQVWGIENPFVNLKLRVNMLFQPIGGEDIYTAGDFNGWDTGSAVMTNIGGSIYEYEVPVLRNSQVKFRFYNGATIGSEVVPDTCGVDDGIGLGFARYVNVGLNDTVYGPVCFGECGNCVIVEPVYVNFSAQVDMSQQTVAADGVYMIGNFGDGTLQQVVPMTAGADNVYTATAAVLEGTQVRYRFQNGSMSSGLEVVPPACGAMNTDNVYEREAFIGEEDLSAGLVCFSECDTCIIQPSGVAPVLAEEWLLWPNPTCGQVYLKGSDSDAIVRVMDATGRTVLASQRWIRNMPIELGNLTSGMYYVEIVSGATAARRTLVVDRSLTIR